MMDRRNPPKNSKPAVVFYTLSHHSKQDGKKENLNPDPIGDKRKRGVPPVPEPSKRGRATIAPTRQDHGSRQSLMPLNNNVRPGHHGPPHPPSLAANRPVRQSVLPPTTVTSTIHMISSSSSSSNNRGGVAIRATESSLSQLAIVQKQIDELNHLLVSKQAECDQLHNERAHICEELTKTQEKYSQEKDKLINVMEEKVKMEEKYQLQIKQLTVRINDLEHERSQLLNKQRELELEKRGLELTIQNKNSELAQMKSELNNISNELSTCREINKKQENLIDDFKKQVSNLEGIIRKFEERARDDEIVRKKLHNAIQELKGNIRVFIRVRPDVPTEVPEDDSPPHSSSSSSSEAKLEESVFVYPDGVDQKTIELSKPEVGVDGSKRQTKFQFQLDRVFRPESSQAEVFDEISQLVQSALDGYKVSIFAYGQTGSGKTHTMEGPKNWVDLMPPSAMLLPSSSSSSSSSTFLSSSSSLPADCGIIPRAIELIFRVIEQLKKKCWSFECKTSILEIYNEQVRDLIGDEKKKQNNNNNNKKPQVKLAKGESGNMEASVSLDVEQVTIANAQELLPLLLKAVKNRSMAATELNDRSSRSHSVFRLYLNGTHTTSGQKTYGLLNLIDLAGSERVKKSKAAGVRLQEAQAINKSLSCLSDVISALANKEKHIPYRNSRLTHILQDSFGADSKTLMFVTLSPSNNSIEETLCSLRFAAKVNSCQIGTARRQVKI